MKKLKIEIKETKTIEVFLPTKINQDKKLTELDKKIYALMFTDCLQNKRQISKWTASTLSFALDAKKEKVGGRLGSLLLKKIISKIKKGKVTYWIIEHISQQQKENI